MFFGLPLRTTSETTEPKPIPLYCPAFHEGSTLFAFTSLVTSGSTENAIFVAGRLHKISEELAWEYDSRDYLKPWRVRGETVDLAFEPFHDRRARTELGVITAHTDQCFGHWSGWMADSAGERVEFAGILGWAEDVHNRW